MQVNVSCTCMLVHTFQNEASIWEWPTKLDTQCMLGYMVSLNTAFCMLEMRNDWQGFMHAQLQYTAAGGVVLGLQVWWCGVASGVVWGVESGMVWDLQLQGGAHLVFEVSARDVQQVQQASHVVVLEA